MPVTPSHVGQHLRYRLWIAEMNADTTVLRIFDDHIAELLAKKNKPGVEKTIGNFKQQFTKLRNEIDELKHEMHLNKMKLAAQARDKASAENNISPEDHAALEKRYYTHREKFDKAKQAFVDFKEE